MSLKFQELFNLNIQNGVITITEYISKSPNPSLVIPAVIHDIPVKIIGGHAFFGVTGVKKVIIEDGISTISSFAFADSEIESIIIPSSVTTVGNAAFENCQKLKQICFYGNMPKIHDLAFGNCFADVFCEKGAKDWEFLNLGRPIHRF